MMFGHIANGAFRRSLWAVWILVGTIVCVCGCASYHVDWYSVYDARAELVALEASPYRGLVVDEAALAKVLVDQAEAALAEDHLDAAAQVSKLALLRVEYAHAVGRTKAARRETVTAVEGLEATAQRADALHKELAGAQEALRARRP